MADLYNVREIVTGKFYQRHVVLIRAASASSLSEDDLDEVAKKLSEQIYQSRGVTVNTVIVLGQQEAMSLKFEVLNKQARFEKAAPAETFLSDVRFPHYERGSTEGSPSSKKRASFVGLRQFRYGVVAVSNEHGPAFKIDHHGGVL